jgi:hypothetical protein
VNVSKIGYLTDRGAIYERSQLRKDCFLARGSKNPDAQFTVAEIQYREKASNAVSQPEIGTAIESDVSDLQAIDKLNGDFV